MMAKLYQRSAVRMDDLIAQALDIQGCCKDIILPGAFTGRRGNKKETGALNPGLTSASISLEGDYGTLNFLAPMGGNGEMTLSVPVSARLTQWSFYQLCSVRLGVPHAFMAKCLEAEIPEIREVYPNTVDTFMRHYDAATRIRLYQPEVGGPIRIRGIVSASYAVFDSDQVLATVKDAMSDDFNVVGYHINEEGAHIRLTSPEPLNVDGEDLYPGLLITSGDVGNGSLQVKFFLYKQVCKNGLVMEKMTGKVLHKRHLGLYGADDFRESLEDALASFPTFCANAAELIEKARRKELDPTDLKKELDSFKASVKLTEKEEAQIVRLAGDRYAGNGGVITVWGFVNALTEFAQEARFDLDTRMDIETYAADLLHTAVAA